jgi:hypothetical protein
MPLEIARLRRSRAWLLAKRTPELAFYQINLWTASWHDTPAASLEDDDDVLADLAMCDPKRWRRIKVDVMRGWVKCSDERWYHPVVAEKAMEAWKGKLEQRWRSECARIKKHNDRHKTDLPRPEFLEWMSLGCPQGQALPVPRDKPTLSPGTDQTCPEGQGSTVPRDIHSKGKGERQGQGQGQGQGELKPSVPGGTAAEAAQKSPEQLTKDELWRVGKSLLAEAGMPKGQCGSFVGSLVKGYGSLAVIEAVRAAVVARPADPAEYLKAACQHRKGERPNAQEALELSNRAIAARLAGEAA